MKSLKEYNFSFWIGILCLIALIYSISKQKSSISEKNKEFSSNGNSVIGKVYAFKHFKAHRTYSYYYFVDAVKYRGTYDSDIGYEEGAIGRFYEVRCLKNDPSISKLFLEYEMDDTNEILNSGFKMVKSSYFDPNKNQYFKDSIINYR